MANEFLCVDWIQKEAQRKTHDWEAERRAFLLRQSIIVAEKALDAAEAGIKIGEPITIRLPKRYPTK